MKGVRFASFAKGLIEKSQDREDRTLLLAWAIPPAKDFAVQERELYLIPSPTTCSWQPV